MLMHNICFMLFILTGVDSCSIDICLTWKIRGDLFSLMCKVSDAHFTVLIKDPRNTSLGLCTPGHTKSKCHKVKNNTESIMYNSRTKETILTIREKDLNRLDGNWSCSHGDKNDIAVIEVTVLHSVKNHTSKKHFTSDTISTECTVLLLRSTAIGFLIGFIGSKLVIWTIIVVCLRCQDKSKEFKLITLLVIILFGIIIPYVIGRIEERDCQGQQVFVVFGAFLGLMCTCILIKHPQQSEENVDGPAETHGPRGRPLNEHHVETPQQEQGEALLRTEQL